LSKLNINWHIQAEPALGAAMLAWTHHYNKIKDSLWLKL
jgi:hypothetical protein